MTLLYKCTRRIMKKCQISRGMMMPKCFEYYLIELFAQNVSWFPRASSIVYQNAPTNTPAISSQQLHYYLLTYPFRSTHSYWIVTFRVLSAFTVTPFRQDILRTTKIFKSKPLFEILHFGEGTTSSTLTLSKRTGPVSNANYKAAWQIISAHILYRSFTQM